MKMSVFFYGGLLSHSTTMAWTIDRMAAGVERGIVLGTYQVANMFTLWISLPTQNGNEL
jgi:hypothetical protein